MVEAYVDADVLVLTSLNEPWGLVVNEAAACGIPSIVSTRAGAALDLIENNRTGLTFDPEVVGGLERCIEQFSRQPSLARRMGELARNIILTRRQSYYCRRPA